MSRCSADWCATSAASPSRTTTVRSPPWVSMRPAPPPAVASGVRTYGRRNATTQASLSKWLISSSRVSRKGPLLGTLSKRERVAHLARGTTREHQPILELITLFSSLVFDTVATPLHQLGKLRGPLTAAYPPLLRTVRQENSTDSSSMRCRLGGVEFETPARKLGAPLGFKTIARKFTKARLQPAHG
jgi:hypothetical protein